MSEENVAFEEVQEQEIAVKVKAVCKKCGKEMEEDQKFCPGCGASREEDTPVAKAPAKKKKLIPLLIGAGAGAAVLAAVVAVIAIVLFIAFRKIPVESIAVDKETVELVEQDSSNVSCIVYPEKATDKTVIWTSSNEKIATVDQFGRITAVGKGECVITVQAGDVQEEIEVVVKKRLPDLKALYDEFCDSDWADLGADHSYLSIDSNPDNKDDYYALYSVTDDAIEAIHKKLGLPDSLMEDMNQTTWSMGKQEEVFENIGIRITWTYHPDKGLEVTYKLIAE